MIVNIDVATQAKSEKMYSGDTPVLKYEVNTPELWSDAQGVKKLNQQYLAKLKTTQEYCRGDLYRMAAIDAKEAAENGYPVHEYQYLKTFDVTANGNCVLSLYSDTYEYTGGAHGNTERTSQTWHFPGGHRLSLASLFPVGTHYRAALIARIIAIISRNPEAYFDDYKKLAAEKFNADSFYLTPEGLAIYYQQYDIAPYSSGIPVFEFTYDSVGAAPPRCVR